jgi:hypothetical protein
MLILSLSLSISGSSSHIDKVLEEQKTIGEIKVIVSKPQPKPKPIKHYIEIRTTLNHFGQPEINNFRLCLNYKFKCHV